MIYNGSVQADYVGLVGEVTALTQIRFLSANKNTPYDVRMEGLTLLGYVAAGYIVGRNSYTSTVGADNTSYDINICAGTNLEAKYAGGIVGYNASDLNVKNLNIKNFNTKYSNATYVGGILGYSQGNADISNCNVTNATLDACGGVGSGEVRTVGGIVGKNTTLLKVQYCNVKSSWVMVSVRQDAQQLKAVGGTEYFDKKYSDNVIRGTDGVSKVSEGNQYVGGNKIEAVAYIGGIVGYYTNEEFGTISNNIITDIELSHNVSTKSNETSIDSIYPVGGKFIGYATSYPHQFSGNSGSTSNSLSHIDNFKLFTAIYKRYIGFIWESNLYEVGVIRSYFNTDYDIGRVGKEREEIIYNGNMSERNKNGLVSSVFNNYKTERNYNGKEDGLKVGDKEYNNCGYCYVPQTNLSANGRVPKPTRTDDIFSVKIYDV